MKPLKLSSKHVTALRWLLRQAHLHHRCEAQHQPYDQLSKYYGVKMTRAIDAIRLIEEQVNAKGKGDNRGDNSS